MRSLLVAAALASTGCLGLKYASGSWGGGCTSHGGESTAGRVSYGVTHLTHDGRAYFVLLSEGGGGSCHAGPPASGVLRGRDGRTVEWACDSPDGRAGAVTIGAERFDLGRGQVFLVNLRDGNPGVEQVLVPGDALGGGPLWERLKALGTTHERLGAFLDLCEKPK